MSQAMLDYEACRVQLFDAPFDLDLRDQMLVIGDRVEAEGYSLGLRIALSEALTRETDRSKRAAIKAQLEFLPDSEAKNLLGPFAPYRSYRRALDLDWLGGSVFKARVDTRHLGKLAGVTDSELLAIALKAPALRTARHLWVRTRGQSEDLELLSVIADSAKNSPDLETVLVGTNPRPRSIARFRETARERRLQKLNGSLPRLFLLSIELGALPRSLPQAVRDWPATATASQLGLLAAPLSEADRLFIGRGLWSSEPEIRAAAAQAVVRCNALGAYAESLLLLLRPRVCSNPEDIAIALRESRQSCPPLTRMLRRISSDASRYQKPVRSAAGIALARRKEFNVL